MKASVLREQTVEELLQQEAEMSKSIQDLRVKRVLSSSSEHPLKIRTMRRDLAKIKTILNEKKTKPSSGSDT